MMIPSIDLMGGSAVQLIGGKEKAIDAGDPRPIADRFGLVGEVAVIDLDAALGRGSNADTIRDLLPRARCRVGGGIRDAETALAWLDAGASKVILGTAATPAVLRELPRERVIAALDARDGSIVTEGWTKDTRVPIEARLPELRDLVGGFLVTFVEAEGRMGGVDAERIARLAELAAPARLTIAGGVRAPEDIAIADRAGADAQVGMALYSGAFDLAEGFCAPLRSDRPDGLWPTVVSDPSGRTLGLAYSDLGSVRDALEHARGSYRSRSRDALWVKGAGSGDTQDLLGIDVDCDRDALRFTVRQRGRGFCHTGTDGCFGDLDGLAKLDRTLAHRLVSAPEKSYTRRLLEDPDLLRSKLIEEARELAESERPDHAAHEAADLLYFALVAARARGATLEDIERVLDERATRVTRRRGDAKPDPERSDP
mgnify:CR=1 FL=1